MGDNFSYLPYVFPITAPFYYAYDYASTGTVSGPTPVTDIYNAATGAPPAAPPGAPPAPAPTMAQQFGQGVGEGVSNALIVAAVVVAAVVVVGGIAAVGGTVYYFGPELSAAMAATKKVKRSA